MVITLVDWNSKRLRFYNLFLYNTHIFNYQLLVLVITLNKYLMKLSSFKSTAGIGAIDLYQSTKSERLVGSAFTNSGEKVTFVTTVPFDLKGDIYVYPTEVDGEMIHMLSNKEKKAAVATL